MARVKKVVDAGGGRIRLSLLCEGGEVRLNIGRDAYAAVGEPVCGCEISENDFEALKYSDEEYRALKKALSLLAFSDKNRRTLLAKLRAAGFCREIAEAAVNECAAHGYLDERRQLAILISDEANRALRGPVYIKRKLMGKGYSSMDIDAVMQELVDGGDVDFTAVFRRLAEKRGAYDAESRRELMFKYGFGHVDE